MIRSMTGFGRSELAEDGRRMVCEVKSVNNRFLDISVKLPRSMSLLEETVKGRVKGCAARGRVEVFISYENTREDTREIRLDLPLAASYREALSRLADLGAEDTVTALQLSGMPGVMSVSEREDDREVLESLLTRAADEALETFVSFREKEGQRLWEDIDSRLRTLEEAVTSLEAIMPHILAEYDARLRQRIGELLGDAAPDPARIATEVAIMADRLAIDEECTRLRSHFAAMREEAASPDVVGRKLDFIVQELNREVNTICSKANALEVTKTGLSMKNEVEKIREQVQNIE